MPTLELRSELHRQLARRPLVPQLWVWIEQHRVSLQPWLQLQLVPVLALQVPEKELVLELMLELTLEL